MGLSDGKSERLKKLLPQPIIVYPPGKVNNPQDRTKAPGFRRGLGTYWGDLLSLGQSLGLGNGLLLRRGRGNPRSGRS